MTNELIQDAEESQAIEKTATEQSESTTAAAEAVAPVTTETPAEQTDDAVAETVENADQTPVAAAPESAEDAYPSSEPEAVAAGDANPSGEVLDPSESEMDNGSAESGPSAAVKETAPADHAPTPEAAEADEPAAPAEIDFGAILEQFEQEQAVFHQGDLVEGKVVGITDRGVLVDFGYKSEGFVPVDEFTGPNGEMTATVGETVEVLIRTMHAGDAAPELSKMDALGRKVWDDIEAAYNAETPIVGRVVDKTKGGLRVDINGVEAFLPGSQIDSRPIRGLDSYIGEDIEAQIIKFSRRRNNIVLSRKVITDLVVNAQKVETLAKIEVGHVVDGTIKNLTDYGAFVDIGGIDGLLHVTDMSWGRIHHPADQFKAGDHLQVKILKLDPEKEKVALGFKQLLPDPWSTVVEVYPVNTKLKGVVSSVTEYGVFVELEAGVEGLVHVSEISWSRRAQSPKRMFHKNQEVEVQVLGVDTVEKRISLGMKQFQDNPWDTVDIKYPVGAKIIGRVRNLTDFGVFIELEPGIDGLVHVSDITWAKKIKHPKDVLKKDQEVEAIVTSIDKRGQRLSLSMKDLTPSAWEGFVATHRPGDIVKGKVSRFTNFGVFVELDEGLEGLCHISELSDERVENAESVAKLGQEMDFKILRIEQADQKIGLSHRAVGKADEPVADTKMYSTEAKGGMASLGELSKLKFGDAEAETPAEQTAEEKKKAKQAVKKIKAEEFAAKEAAAEAESVAKLAETETQTEKESEPDEKTEDSPASEKPETEEPKPVSETEPEPASDDVETPRDAAEEELESESKGTVPKPDTESAPETKASPADETDDGETPAAKDSGQDSAAESKKTPADATAEDKDAEAEPSDETVAEDKAEKADAESEDAPKETTAKTAKEKDPKAKTHAAKDDAESEVAGETEKKVSKEKPAVETEKKSA